MKLKSFLQNYGQGFAAAGSILFALACVVALGLWGAYRDLDQVRQTIWRSEISRVNSHAERTVGYLESEMASQNLSSDFKHFQTNTWLRGHWSRVIPGNADRVFGAITAPDGTLIAHSEASLENQNLQWPSMKPDGSYEGIEISKLEPSKVTLGIPAWDITVPILVKGQPLGTYHAGINAPWVENQILVASESVIYRWNVVIGGIILVVALALLSLYSITKWNIKLRSSLVLSEVRRAREISQVMSGLAHEIRNPLNAIRLNLHALERVFKNDSWIPTQEIREILHESAGEIDRIAGLMTEVVDYSKREPVDAAAIDLVEEVRRTIAFVHLELEEAEITIRECFHIASGNVSISPDRLRQILLNLLRNSAEAAGEGGWIELQIAHQGTGYLVSVEDSGPGIPHANREIVFDPFYSTKTSGMGLGLSMARKYAVEVNGTLDCRTGPNGGAMFVLWLPVAKVQPIQGVA